MNQKYSTGCRSMKRFICKRIYIVNVFFKKNWILIEICHWTSPKPVALAYLYIIIDVTLGLQYKFVVDGEWRHDDRQPSISSNLGTVNTILLTTDSAIVTPQMPSVGRSSMDVDNGALQRVVWRCLSYVLPFCLLFKVSFVARKLVGSSASCVDHRFGCQIAHCVSPSPWYRNQIWRFPGIVLLYLCRRTWFMNCFLSLERLG